MTIETRHAYAEAMAFVRASLVLAALLFMANDVWAQEEPVRRDRESDRISLDFSFAYVPAELREHAEPRIRWKRIWGAVGVAGYHVFPAQQTGANVGPPRQIWSHGWGTSLWRDPVTGWPLQ